MTTPVLRSTSLGPCKSTSPLPAAAEDVPKSARAPRPLRAQARQTPALAWCTARGLPESGAAAFRSRATRLLRGRPCPCWDLPQFPPHKPRSCKAAAPIPGRLRASRGATRFRLGDEEGLASQEEERRDSSRRARGVTQGRSPGSPGQGRGPHTREELCSRVGPQATARSCRQGRRPARALQWSGGDGDLERLDAHSTCPAHGWPGPFQRTQPFPSERDVLLGRGQAFGLEKLPPVLVTEDRVHGLQEVLPALRGAAGGRCRVRKTVLRTRECSVIGGAQNPEDQRPRTHGSELSARRGGRAPAASPLLCDKAATSSTERRAHGLCTRKLPNPAVGLQPQLRLPRRFRDTRTPSISAGHPETSHQPRFLQGWVLLHQLLPRLSHRGHSRVTRT